MADDAEGDPEDGSPGNEERSNGTVKGKIRNFAEQMREYDRRARAALPPERVRQIERSVKIAFTVALVVLFVYWLAAFYFDIILIEL